MLDDDDRADRRRPHPPARAVGRHGAGPVVVQPLVRVARPRSTLLAPGDGRARGGPSSPTGSPRRDDEDPARRRLPSDWAQVEPTGTVDAAAERRRFVGHRAVQLRRRTPRRCATPSRAIAGPTWPSPPDSPPPRRATTELPMQLDLGGQPRRARTRARSPTPPARRRARPRRQHDGGRSGPRGPPTSSPSRPRRTTATAWAALAALQLRRRRARRLLAPGSPASLNVVECDAASTAAPPSRSACPRRCLVAGGVVLGCRRRPRPTGAASAAERHGTAAVADADPAHRARPAGSRTRQRRSYTAPPAGSTPCASDPVDRRRLRPGETSVIGAQGELDPPKAWLSAGWYSEGVVPGRGRPGRHRRAHRLDQRARGLRSTSPS